MRCTYNCQPITTQHAYRILLDQAELQGMDKLEATALFATAAQEDLDGEIARDELQSICGEVEIYV